ncbi:MAG: FliH/SctL family protein, partial [Rubrivivax sp.]
MTNSSSGKPFPNVPPPSGSKAGSPYTRFIPREELGNFQPWKPGDLDGPEPRPRGRGREGFAPTEEEWRGLVDEARQEGYQEGYRDGLSALESLRQSFVTQASSDIGSLISAFDRQFEELESTMARAVARSAVLLARQVLRIELASRPEVVAALAEQAIQAVQTSARHIVVHVNPEDLPFVAAGAAETLQARGARVQMFQDKDNYNVRCCIVSSRVGNAGLTLTTANQVYSWPTGLTAVLALNGASTGSDYNVLGFAAGATYEQ